MRGLMIEPPSIQRDDIHRDGERLSARRDDNTIDRGNIGIVAADRHLDVVAAYGNAIGRIEPAPAHRLAAPHRHPGVRRVGAFEAGAAPPPGWPRCCAWPNSPAPPGPR